jgi:hypothetical protein
MKNIMIGFSLCFLLLGCVSHVPSPYLKDPQIPAPLMKVPEESNLIKGGKK